jgi:hypothetical protein
MLDTSSVERANDSAGAPSYGGCIESNHQAKKRRTTMTKHLTGKRIVTIAVAVAVVALTGAGATFARVSAPAPADPTGALYDRLIVRAELPGFTPEVCPKVETDAGRWARGNLSVDQLRRNGFVGGLRQPLQSSRLDADALVSVALFGSAHGARTEIDNEIASARRSSGSFTAFTVAGIPAARGFALSGRGTAGYNVVFSDGPYVYLVGIGFRAGTAKHHSNAQAIAAATALYRRVHSLGSAH